MVNVFIPKRNIDEAIKSLHTRSISTMLREANIILKAINERDNNPKAGYGQHPITLMWKKHKLALIHYQALLLYEYNLRMFPHISLEFDHYAGQYQLQDFIDSFDNEYFKLQQQHLRHKGLGYKTDWYEKQFPNVETKQGYKVLINNEWIYYPKHK